MESWALSWVTSPSSNYTFVTWSVGCFSKLVDLWPLIGHGMPWSPLDAGVQIPQQKSPNGVLPLKFPHRSHLGYQSFFPWFKDLQAITQLAASRDPRPHLKLELLTKLPELEFMAKINGLKWVWLQPCSWLTSHYTCLFLVPMTWAIAIHRSLHRHHRIILLDLFSDALLAGRWSKFQDFFGGKVCHLNRCHGCFSHIFERHGLAGKRM